MQLSDPRAALPAMNVTGLSTSPPTRLKLALPSSTMLTGTLPAVGGSFTALTVTGTVIRARPSLLSKTSTSNESEPA